MALSSQQSYPLVVIRVAERSQTRFEGGPVNESGQDVPDPIELLTIGPYCNYTKMITKGVLNLRGLLELAAGSSVQVNGIFHSFVC